MKQLSHRLTALASLGLLIAGELAPSMGTAVMATAAALTLTVAPEARAIPPHGAVRRTSRRTTRRVVRRHLFLMPAGAVAVTHRAYRYFHHGGIYYYPYMIGGRTTYVEVDVDVSGKPLAPPPAAEVEVEINL